ncbi:MAG: tryptophan 7-halogenase [Verrucomicrobiae bacterium]|nr:tryptophan 7-halogenase [Verrucomicrobiae bacterium]
MSHVPSMIRKQHFDVVVLGSGFAGTLTAMIARKHGCSVLLVEKSQHPRMAIGESTTPLTNLLLEEIAKAHDLAFLLDFTQYGKWKKAHPDLKVGLKRGFSFYNRQSKEKSSELTKWDDELLVAASPNNIVADTQWWRADWDLFLVGQCKKMGVEYSDLTDISDLREEDDGVLLWIKTERSQRRVKAGLLIDACGGRAGIGQLLSIRKKTLNSTPETFAVHGHFSGVARIPPSNSQLGTGPLPYHPEDSAIHHIIDGGWVWSLRFDHGQVSAGAVLREKNYRSIQDQSPESIWSSVVNKHDELKRLFQKAVPLYPLRKIKRVGFEMERTYGNRWIMLPSSAGFIDPLLSTGFPLTLQTIQRLAFCLSPQSLRQPGPLAALSSLARSSKADLRMVDQLIGTLYATMGDFRHFAATSLIYFAAVSFTEAALRLGKKKLAPGFLFSEDPTLSVHILSTFENIKRIHQSEKTAEERWSDLRSCVDAAISEFNVIGVSTKTKTPYFRAETAPLFEHAHKLESTTAEIKNMLISAGLA